MEKVDTVQLDLFKGCPRGPGSGHFVKLEGSQKCQRVLRYLLTRYPSWVSTREIDRGADVCAVNSWMWSLSRNGITAPGIPVYERRQDAEGNSLYRLTGAGRLEGERRLAEIAKVKLI
jgi:hypothetical protein